MRNATHHFINDLKKIAPTTLVCLLLGVSCQAGDIIIGSFTGTSYGGWEKTGTAFDRGPAGGELLGRLEIENSIDGGVASSEMEGDEPQGTLTSPKFKISKPYIAFRIAGGNYERHTCINLLIDGRIVRSATGWWSDRLTPLSWDVGQFKDALAQIQIVDEASGRWGHINVERVVQTDTPERLPLAKAPLYAESLRPQFHFTARQWTMDRLNPKEREEGWVNDLNGLVYYEGEYHLFAQRWNKCWIHAVSKDLVHWTELEPAFWEEKLDWGVQSGTCVIDYENTSKLSPSKANPAMVAFWSRNDNRSQCISYSLDKGRTWKHYEKNPILVFPERDPKVFWHAPGKHWVMLLSGLHNKYHIFTSENLLDWRDAGNPIPDGFECPDFFELPLDGDNNNKKWVLVRADGVYSVGTFDGKKFTPETDRIPGDVNPPQFYATQSWHNTETGDGRRIQVAWMRGSNFPNMPFNQQVSFPCELTLRTTAKGPRIFREPIPEIQKLHRGKPNTWENRALRNNDSLLLEPSGQLFHIKGEVDIAEGARLILRIRGIPLAFTERGVEAQTHLPAGTIGKVRSFEILVDRASIETFVNKGEISITKHVLPREEGLSLKTEGGVVMIKSLEIHTLNSAWTTPSADH